MRKKRVGTEEKKTAYFMIAPATVLIVLLGVVPICYVIWLSLNEVNPVTINTDFYRTGKL